jgi:hypothetical protein
MCVCVCMCVRLCVCVCVCERERERERETHAQAARYAVAEGLLARVLQLPGPAALRGVSASIAS